MTTGQHIRNTTGADQPIRYVQRHEIDPTRWDACIENAANTIIYGFHYYLDYMASDQWDALILGDYEAIMPLPWRRKYGIRYLYQPPFTQQSGIFASKPLPAETIEAFLRTARQHFRFAEISLNYGNEHQGLQPRTNYIMSLDHPYERLAANYKKELNRNLRFASRSTLTYSPTIGLPETLEAYRRQYAARTPHVGPDDYRHFEQLCNYLQSRKQLILRAVSDNSKQILATTLLLRDKRRLYLLQPTTSETGRKTRANHFLLDALIREYAGKPVLLDFEGSDLPGVAHFYANFGATRQPYFFYRHNHLPWPINLLKG